MLKEVLVSSLSYAQWTRQEVGSKESMILSERMSWNAYVYQLETTDSTARWPSYAGPIPSQQLIKILKKMSMK